jgi:hypothetical protein
MKRRHLNLVSISLVLFTIPVATCFAQAPKGSRAPEVNGDGRTSSINWGDKQLAAQLSRNVVAGPKIALQHSGKGSSSAMMATLNQQRQAAKAAGVPAVQSGAGGNSLLASPESKTLLAPPSTGMLGPTRTQSANGSAGAPSGSNSATAAQPRRGTSGSASISHAQPGGTMCLHPGITAVDKATTGIIFSPGYSYVIHGCGFGSQPGSVYLMGVKQQPVPPQRLNTAPLSLHSDWVRLLLAGANSHLAQRNWSNTEIVVIVDPNTSGFDDSITATLVVILSDNVTQLQAHGFQFFAARATQTLTSLPITIYGASNSRQIGILRSGTSFTPARVNDAAGHLIQANLVSPSANSIVLPGHTFAVVREDNSAPFPSGTDSINLVYGLLPSFEVQSIQLFYASLPQSACPSTFSNNGNWNAALMGSADNIDVSWQEQSCGHNGVSAYAIDVTVVGPKGVSAF